MKFSKTNINGVVLIEPNVIKDQRGYFLESFNKEKFKKVIDKVVFIQENESKSSKGVIRGLHFQNPPFAQAKLVRVIKGSVLDVAVDLRKKSKTYGMYYSIVLSEKNNKSFFIPKGFAHGFLSLEDNTVFSYKCSGLYNKKSEESLLWNDKDLNIDWQITDPIVSEKDSNALLFKDFKTKFND